ERDRPIPVERFEWPEDAVLHAGSGLEPTPLPDGGQPWVPHERAVTGRRDAADVGREKEEKKMIRKHFRFKRFALGLAFAVVSAALLVPTAVAKPVGYEMSSPQTITPLQADGLRWQAMADFYTQQAQQASAPGITAAGTAI